MAYNLKLTERIQAELNGIPFVEKKMFGSVGYILNGNRHGVYAHAAAKMKATQ
jgi:hypothetical protein